MVSQRHELLCLHDWRKQKIGMDMDVIAENSTTVKKAWKTAWVLDTKRKQTAATKSVGEIKIQVQFEDDPEGVRRATTSWHMPDDLTEYLSREVCRPVCQGK